MRGVSFLASLVCCLLLFYTVESLRREDGTGLAPIHDATPVRTGSILFGKSLANALVGVLAIAATLVTDLIVLAVQGQTSLDPSPFLLVWCVVLLPTFLVWTSFVSLLYSLVRNRYTTYALALGAFIWSTWVNETEGLSWAWNWPLWGALQWSDMGTFELIREELILNRALMLAATLLFTLLTVSLLWGVAIGGIWPQVIDIRAETRALADAHTKHKVAHPGWSFPARIWSGSAPLDMPTPRLMEQARLRGYARSCPPVSPGEYCSKTGTVIPRGGSFPEGVQPPGPSAVGPWS